MVASFSTDSYSITADLEVDPESPAVDGKQRGRLLQVYMESRKKETATLRALGGTVAFQPGYLACTRLKETSSCFAALDSVCLLFYRTDTGHRESRKQSATTHCSWSMLERSYRLLMTFCGLDRVIPFGYSCGVVAFFPKKNSTRI